MAPDKIRTIRKKMELTQASFGSLLGISTSTVNRWEVGRDASGYTELPLLLLEAALRHYEAADVRRELRFAKGVPLRVVKTLMKFKGPAKGA